MSGEREIENTDQRQSGKVQEQRSAPDNVVIINCQIIMWLNKGKVAQQSIASKSANNNTMFYLY